MKSGIKKIAFIVLGALCLTVIWHWSLIAYGVRQGMGQLKIVWNARPIEEVLKDPAFPDSLKQKLNLIKDIKHYAIESLDLNDSENYQTVFDQKGEELMWVVTASEPFKLQAKTWDFPIVGKVPYKGFFNKEAALFASEELQKEGWDVGIRNPGGWSTLGWFTDPILSGMLDRNEGDLASLIIHEMVHATIFIKDSVDFNENFASFIADTAAYDFIAWKYGKGSDEYITYVQEANDYVKYSNHVLRGALLLDSLYKTMDSIDDIALKKDKKEALIRVIVNAMDTLSLERFQIPKRFKDKLPNNDYFLAYRRYQSKQTDLKDELTMKYNGNLREMLADYRALYPFL